jgi:hypothetical protein
MSPVIIAIALATASPAPAHQQLVLSQVDTTIQVRKRLRLTPPRPPSAGDSARGQALVDSARAAVAKYRAPGAAERDGYEVFAPQVKAQRVLHYVNRSNAVRNRFSFDPARPTALLYEPVAGSEPVLLGVMYTMPASATLEELDARVPLSLTSWHQHTNVCRPKRMREEDIASFVRAKSARLATREACEAAGGRFIAESRTWMVHVNVMAADGTDVWAHKGHTAAASGAHMH